MAKITASATSESMASQTEAVDAYMEKTKTPDEGSGAINKRNNFRI